ncbi:inner membrane protein alx [Acidimicrobiaceae bacterium]|nr:inner membrane protein alx [Acidimicrobiaceae bacterium]
MFNMFVTSAEESKKFVDVVIPWWGWEMLIAVFVVRYCSTCCCAIEQHMLSSPKRRFSKLLCGSHSAWFHRRYLCNVQGTGEGTSAAVEYLSGYLIEYSLSIDNVFVWAMIFVHFKVPNQYQHRTLFWGIFGALVMRFIFIALGVQVITRLSRCWWCLEFSDLHGNKNYEKW